MCTTRGGFWLSPASLMAVSAALFHFPVGFSRLLPLRTNSLVFCIFRTLFKSPYPSHSIGLTASSAQNVISRLFIRLRTLLKIGSLASLFESAPCALFCKNTGGRGVHLSNRTPLSLFDLLASCSPLRSLRSRPPGLRSTRLESWWREELRPSFSVSAVSLPFPILEHGPCTLAQSDSKGRARHSPLLLSFRLSREAQLC